MNARSLRAVPLIVAFPMFLQNLDSSVLGTALPAIAASLGVQVLHLNLAITSYLVSLVLFLPASAWLADRHGARRVFCAAVLVFTGASALCGAAQSLPQLVAFRLLQGVGGAMMVPVGRLILLRSVPPALMVQAMVWFTVPGAIGRLLGPLFGGAIVMVMSWRWIFLVNIPCGLAAVWLALRHLDADAPAGEEVPSAPDVVGILLLAAALAGFLGGLEMVGKHLVPASGIVLMLAGGALALWRYLRRMRKQAEPLIDFRILRFPAYRAAVVGGFPLRVAIGSAPFILPLLLQLGFGLSPLRSGLLMLSSAAGALAARVVLKTGIDRLGYRRMLVIAACGTTCFYGSYLLLTPATPVALVACLFAVAGLFNATSLVMLASTGFGGIPRERMGHATAMSSMAMQMAVTLGVALGAVLLELGHGTRGGSAAAQPFTAADFRLALLAMSLIPIASTVWFVKTAPDVPCAAEAEGKAS